MGLSDRSMACRVFVYLLIGFIALCCVLALGLGLGLGLKSPGAVQTAYANGSIIGGPYSTTTAAASSSEGAVAKRAGPTAMPAGVGRREMLAGRVAARQLD